MPADGFERAIVDSLYDGVYHVDRGRRIRSWNKGAERLTGYAASAVVGKFCYQNAALYRAKEGGRNCVRLAGDAGVSTA